MGFQTFESVVIRQAIIFKWQNEWSDLLLFKIII